MLAGTALVLTILCILSFAAVSVLFYLKYTDFKKKTEARLNDLDTRDASVDKAHDTRFAGMNNAFGTQQLWTQQFSLGGTLDPKALAAAAQSNNNAASANAPPAPLTTDKNAYFTFSNNELLFGVAGGTPIRVATSGITAQTLTASNISSSNASLNAIQASSITTSGTFDAQGLFKSANAQFTSNVTACNLTITGQFTAQGQFDAPSAQFTSNVTAASLSATSTHTSNLDAKNAQFNGTLQAQKLQLGQKWLLTGDAPNDDMLRLYSATTSNSYYGGLATGKLQVTQEASIQGAASFNSPATFNGGLNTTSLTATNEICLAQTCLDSNVMSKLVNYAKTLP